jgi:hypothetical protein
LTAVPAFAQTYGGSDNSAQQSQYSIGRGVNDGGMGYDPQNTANNGQSTAPAGNQQATRTINRHRAGHAANRQAENTTTTNATAAPAGIEGPNGQAQAEYFPNQYGGGPYGGGPYGGGPFGGGQYGEAQYGEAPYGGGLYGEAAYGGSPYSGYYNYVAGYPSATGANPDAIGWCQAHFRSFDPATGTYMGLDGARHSCP